MGYLFNLLSVFQKKKKLVIGDMATGSDDISESVEEEDSDIEEEYSSDFVSPQPSRT